MEKFLHTHVLKSNQCSSTLIQTIDAPLDLVWSIVRQFDNPQAYKQFVKSCTTISGDGSRVGSVREVNVISGLPAKSSTERLEKLDDDSHVMVFSIIGGDHRLVNYRSTISLHILDDNVKGGSYKKTVAVESYVVDVPAGSSKEDTCCFANAIVGYNLISLAKATEKMARQLLS